MKILLLEDNLERIKKFKELFRNQELFIFDNVRDAFLSCQENIFHVMFLDHDLDNKIWIDSNEENTGYQFIKYLIENNNHQYKNSLYYIHSSNPIGANRMLNLLLDNNYDGIWIPWLIIINNLL